MIQYKSINHHNTSLTEREEYFKQLNRSEVGPSVFLQTCNRVELYYGDGDIPDSVARHLFRVVCGLESAIVGERAVQGQMKDAYMTARDSGEKLSAGLHKLFECSLQIGKRVRTETQISHGAVSHSLATIEIIEREHIDLKNAHIAIIGVNKLTEDIIKFLKNKGANVVFLANRTEKKAQEMAAPYGIDVFRLDEKREFLREADILISATSAPHAIIFKDDLNPSRKLLAIDLAFPRDIDPEVTELEGVKLYNLQDVEGVVQDNIAIRHDEVEKAQLSRSGFYEELEKKSDRFIAELEMIISGKGITLNRCGSMFTLFFSSEGTAATSVNNFQDTKRSDQERFARYFRNMLQRGIYVSPSQFEGNFISETHTPEILDYVLQSIAESI